MAKSKKINTGVLPRIGARPGHKDYFAGAISGIEYKERLLDGRWLLYRSAGEQQFSIYMDSYGCVSFSFNNGVEENINWLIATGQLTKEKVAELLTSEKDQVMFWEFFNDNKEADLSDRALAKLSGTTKRGNTLSRVADAGRGNAENPGFAVPERVWPYPIKQRQPVFDWDDFYQDIPEDIVKEYSRVFFSVFEITTEFITPTWDSISRHLKHAPVQISAGWCPGWGIDRPVKACDRLSDHATVIDGQEDGMYCDFDTYPGFDVRLAKDYKISGALKIIVEINKKITIPIMQVKENVLYQLVEAPGGFALGINGKLMIDSVDKIIASFMVRNKGSIAGKVATCTMAEWNSVPHINLKGESVQ